MVTKLLALSPFSPYLWLNVSKLQKQPLDIILNLSFANENQHKKFLKRSISQMCCKQMRKWKKFSIWCFLHPLMAAWHMINDCSPQQFHISPFHGWFGGQKSFSSLCVRGVGGKNWNLWPLGCLMVVQNGALPYFGLRCRAQLWQIGQHWAKFYGAVCLTWTQNFHSRIVRHKRLAPAHKIWHQTFVVVFLG